MNFYDFLKWEYNYIILLIVFGVWVFVFRKTFPKNKKPNAKVPIGKKIALWSSILLIGIAVFFVTYLNPRYFGLGTLENFSQIHIIDNKVILFDNAISYHDDEHSGTEDYSSHLRIHVVDTATKKKIYSEMIGTNYSNLVERNQIYLVENSSYRSYSAANTVLKVYRYNLQNKKREVLIKSNGTFSSRGEMLDVYSIKVLNDINVTCQNGDQYIFNFQKEEFELFDGTNFQNSINIKQKFSLRSSAGNSDQKKLSFQNEVFEKSFLFGEILNEFELGDSSLALLSSYSNMDKAVQNYTMVSDKGLILWERNIPGFEVITGVTGLNKIDLSTQVKEICYLTIDNYLYNVNICTGKVNWFLEL